MNQFFYTRKNGDQTFVDSFNTSLVIRSYEYERDKLLVLLSDGHEESREVPDYSNSGKTKGTKRERQWIASEIYLDGDDVRRFREVLSISFPSMPVNVPAKPNPQLEIPFENA